MHDLTPERLTAMQAAFERALELPAGEREAHLHSLVARDAALGAQVRALVAAHFSADAALDRPAVVEPPSDGEPADRWVGRRVGAYEIVRLVGAGGMGAVYEAIRADDQFRKRVAVKLVSAQATSETTVRRFRRERQILANLVHPNIAVLLDGGVTEDGHPYFAMEYVEGEPITRWCDARALPIGDRLALFRQVCAAVQYAHQSLVVHRDLKPGNILVSGDTPANAEVKLLDFGIAKLLPAAAEDSAEQPVTRAGGRAYTPDYASPEQLLGLPIGTRSDVYSLGVVLYELLVGVRPFDLRGRSAGDVERLVSQATPARPSAALGEERARALAERSLGRARTRLTGDLDAIVLKALRKEPERRYGSAAELAADLRDHLDGRPVAARPDGFGYRLGKLVRRRRLETAAVALAVFSIVGGAAASARQARVAEGERVRAEREAARATEVTEFLTTMLGAANPGAFGRDVRVREVLDSAAIKANTLAARPALEAEIRQIIGGTYLALGEHETAERQFRRALEVRRRAAPRGDRNTAVALERVSMAVEYQGRYASADSLLREASALYERFGFEDERARGVHVDGRGRILSYLGRQSEAEPLFEEGIAMELRQRPPNDSTLATAYTNLAVTRSELGKNASAETLLVAAVAAAKRAYGPVHPLVAAIMSPLASVQSRAGAHDRALATYEATIAMRTELLGADHPETAWTIFNYADELREVGRYAESAAWARRVLALRGKTLQDAHPAIGTAMSLLGRALGAMDSLDVAERWLRESLAVRRANLPAGHFLIPSSESILGNHLRLRKRYPQAEALLVDAERKLVAARGERAPIVADARKRLVDLYDAWGRPADAARWRAALADTAAAR